MNTVDSAHPSPDMKRALVVYESMFGNTEVIARAIAEGLAERVPTTVVEVGSAPKDVEGIDLVVVGGPTHAFGMSRPRTRLSAAQQGGRQAATDIGIREWLAAVSTPRTGLTAAAFDTRIQRPRVPGSAARAARRRLRRLGFAVTPKPKSFFVTGTPGPLCEQERQRAHRWGQELAASCTGSSSRAVSTP